MGWICNKCGLKHSEKKDAEGCCYKPLKKKKRLTEIIVYESMRVRVEIFYDRLISTVEAKEKARELIQNEDVKWYR